jgi:NAD(P)-dependent dehydrogenase (short-subunit alcohol dehydrogenase family)
VNTASAAGLVGTAGLGAYTASKHGVVGLTKVAALELARERIRVNAICPGTVRTALVERVEAQDPRFVEELAERHPVGRLGTPEEVAEAVAWLASDNAAFVTGAAIPIDGGITAT